MSKLLSGGCALLFVLLNMRASASEPGTLLGAGATFPAPIYDKWIASFSAKHSGMPIVFKATGSGEGLRQLTKGEVDFAASDIPPGAEQPSKTLVKVIPTAVGGVVPAYNLPGLTEELRMTGEVLAEIYSGHITRWNDPKIHMLNRGAHLPAQDIAVIHRSDGSGTTYVFSDFLSKTSPEWRARVGTGSVLNWPTGKGANGNNGVAALITQTPNAIGYVEYIYAVHEHLSFASVMNFAGRYVRADIDSLNAAALTATSNNGFGLSIMDAGGKEAYSLAAFTWLVIPLHMDKDKQERIMAFLEWVLGPGQNEAEALGYVPLPESIAEQARKLMRADFPTTK